MREIIYITHGLLELLDFKPGNTDEFKEEFSSQSQQEDRRTGPKVRSKASTKGIKLAPGEWPYLLAVWSEPNDSGRHDWRNAISFKS